VNDRHGVERRTHTGWSRSPAELEGLVGVPPGQLEPLLAVRRRFGRVERRHADDRLGVGRDVDRAVVGAGVEVDVGAEYVVGDADQRARAHRRARYVRRPRRRRSRVRRKHCSPTNKNSIRMYILYQAQHFTERDSTQDIQSQLSLASPRGCLIEYQLPLG